MQFLSIVTIKEVNEEFKLPTRCVSCDLIAKNGPTLPMSYPNSTPPKEAMIEANTTWMEPHEFWDGIPSSSTGTLRRWHSCSSIFVDFIALSSSESERFKAESLLRRTSKNKTTLSYYIKTLPSNWFSYHFLTCKNFELVSYFVFLLNKWALIHTLQVGFSRDV